MKILVTGGVGFLGTNICLEAISRGYEVIAFDSLIRKGVEENIPILEKKGVRIFRGDVRNWEDLAHCRDQYGKPDAIIHLAANPMIPWSIQFPEYDFQTNAVGTFAVLEMSRRMKEPIPVIYASSNKVYTDVINELEKKETETRWEWVSNENNQFQRGIDEMLVIDGFGYARSPYGVSKLTGDLYCQEYYKTYGVPTVSNRMSCIYGYYQKGVCEQGWVSHFVSQITKGEGKLDIFGNGKQVRDLLFGTDCAKLYLDELENIDKVKGKAYNIGGGIENTMSLLETIAYIEELSGKKAMFTYFDKRHGDQDIWISDITKIKEDLGWKPTISPKEGIKMMYEKIA